MTTSPTLANPLAGFLIAVSLLAGGVTGAAGTSSGVALRADSVRERAVANSSISRKITARSFGGTSAIVASTIVSEASVPEIEVVGPSSAQLVLSIHQETGLTWDQMAKSLGVSRRAIHQWANGARLSAGNLERLQKFYKAVKSLPYANAEEVRVALLAVDASGRTVLERLSLDITDPGPILTLPLWTPKPLTNNENEVSKS